MGLRIWRENLKLQLRRENEIRTRSGFTHGAGTKRSLRHDVDYALKCWSTDQNPNPNADSSGHSCVNRISLSGEGLKYGGAHEQLARHSGSRHWDTEGSLVDGSSPP